MNEADASQLTSPPTPATQDTAAPHGPVALITSAYAGSAQGVSPQALLERAGVPVALTLPVAVLDMAQPQGMRWREAGCVAAVAAGGDGAVGAVATHAASADLPLGILPLGTANDIARALGIPLTPASAARLIAHGALRWIDAGQAIPSQTAPHSEAHQAAPGEAALSAALRDLPGQASAPGGAYFLHALTMGMNVEFARRATDVTQRRMWGKLTYAVAALESLEDFRPIPVTLSFTGMPGASVEDVVVVHSQAALFAAINLPVFGGRLGLRVPGVRTDDHLLDFVVVEAPEAHHALAAFEAALGALAGVAQSLWGRRARGEAPDAAPPTQTPAELDLPGVRWFRARAVEIETEWPVDLTLDGELRGRTPAVARVAPRAVRLIVPAAR